MNILNKIGLDIIHATYLSNVKKFDCNGEQCIDDRYFSYGYLTPISGSTGEEKFSAFAKYLMTSSFVSNPSFDASFWN